MDEWTDVFYCSSLTIWHSSHFFFKSNFALRRIPIVKAKNPRERNHCSYVFKADIFRVYKHTSSFEGQNWSGKKLNFQIPENISIENKAFGLKMKSYEEPWIREMEGIG